MEDGGRLRAAAAERRRWWLLFACLAVAAGSWSLGAPLMTGHDEASQAVRSAAAARGEVLGTPVPGWDNGLVTVRVPEAYANADAAGSCFLGRPFEWFPGMPPHPPGRGPCPTLDGGGRLVSVPTNQFRHPPLYPMVLGLPTLAFPDQLGAYLMRLVGALICAALLASGLATVPRMRRPELAAVAALVAVTPEVVYLAGTSNTAGLETAASFALWMAVLALALGPAAPDGRLVRRAGAALVVLGVARPLSPGFAVAALVVAAVLASPGRRRALAGRTDVRLWLIAGAASSATTAAWVLDLQRRLPTAPLQGRGLADAVGLVPWWLRGTVGVFGSTDVIPPAALHLAWAAVAAAVLVACLRRSRPLAVLLVAGLGLGAVALLVSGQGLGFPNTGYWWQGRYVLPLLIAALVTAAAAAGGRPGPGERVAGARRQVLADRGGLLIALLVALQAWAFLYAARHYAVGYGGTANPLRYLTDPRWSPPYGPAVLYAVLFTGALAAAGAVVWRSATEAPVPVGGTAVTAGGPAPVTTSPVPAARAVRPS